MKVNKEDFTWACKMALMEQVFDSDIPDKEHEMKCIRENFTYKEKIR